MTFVEDPSRWDEWLLEELTLEDGGWGKHQRATDVDGIWVADRSAAVDRLREAMEEIRCRISEGKDRGRRSDVGGRRVKTEGGRQMSDKDEEGMIRRLRRLTQM